MPGQLSIRWRVLLNLVLLGIVGLAIFTIRSRLVVGNEQQSTISPPVENSYDVGQVLSGEVVSHAFSFTNTFEEPIAIRAEEDIRKDCGCTMIAPETRTLQPGASTKIVATVNTKGRSGRFAYGGTILWSLPNWEKREATIKLQGEICPLLESDPPSLSFGPDEINGASTKEIKFKAGVPMDWARAKVHGYDHDPQVQVVDWKVSGNAAICKVKCSMPDGVEAASGSVAVEVSLAEPRSDFPSTTLRVPVQAYQSIEFTVAPKQILARIDKASGRASARLLVRGKKLANSKHPISSITCDGYRVDWRMTEPSKGGAAVVTIELTPLVGSAKKSEQAVVMGVEGMKPIRFPLLLTVAGK